MKLALTGKLFLAILVSSCLAVISSALIMQWSLSRGFLKFINAMEQAELTQLAHSLETRYQTEGGWDFLRNDSTSWQRIIRDARPAIAPPPDLPTGMPHQPPFQPPRQHNQQPDQRWFLLDMHRAQLAGGSPVPANAVTTALTHKGSVIGYLGLLPRTGFSELPHTRFLKEQRQGLILQTLAIVVLSALLSLLVARKLLRPLQMITAATRQLAAGSYNTRVPATSQDELGQLATDFNSLALSLEHAERTRQNWFADISHELRTPLALLRGEIEAIQDGIRQPDQTTLSSLHDEVLRLGRLIDDLYQLSLSDAGALAYRKASLNLTSLLNATVTAYESEFRSKAITLETRVSEAIQVSMYGDPGRLRQLFSNLLDNALKYTNANGRVAISLRQNNQLAVIEISDTPPGVPAEDLERLFDRLYRVESSRNRTMGGAGLGLAICRNIVEAHGGVISAWPSPLGGLLIHIELPHTGS